MHDSIANLTDAAMTVRTVIEWPKTLAFSAFASTRRVTNAKLIDPLGRFGSILAVADSERTCL
jgi:hypothetical protein